MEAPGEKIHRLVVALDDLVTQEAANIAAGDYAIVAEIQQRTGPLVATLAELGSDLADEIARARIAALFARRQNNIEMIDSQLEIARTELQAVQASASRVARIAPVYGRAEAFGGAGQLRAAV